MDWSSKTVVVTGAGTQTERGKLGNTVATIDASTLQNAPVANFSERFCSLPGHFLARVMDRSVR